MHLCAKLVILCLTVCLILTSGDIKLAQAEQERICTVASADLSKLSFDVFDQDLESPLSWRCLIYEGKLKQAQELIDKYLVINKAVLEQYQFRALYFHAGTLAAADGRNEEAIERMYRALDDNNESADYLSWNEYVLGTIYFLQGDAKKLEQEIEKIESRNLEMDALNLRILKKYRRCPNKTYKEVNTRTSPCENT